MAVINPNNLYTGGATVFDSRPETNMYAQLMLRKKAKEEALDEYERERINHVNPQGVRDRDRPGFDQRIQKIQMYYQQNKDKIKKGNTPESFEHEKNLRDVSTFINQSKERTAKQDAAMKFYQDKLKQDGRIPDDFMKELEVNDKAIDDIVTFDKVTGEPVRSSTFDLKKWLDTPKPFNQQTYIKGFGDIKRNKANTRTEPVEGNPLRLSEITELSFDDEGKQVIAARAADKYQNSYSFAESVKEDIKDPVRRQQLAKTFKEQYGTDPIQPEDYATAYSIELIQPTIKNPPKQIDNKSAIKDRDEAFKRKMFDLAESGRNSRAAMNQQSAGLGDYDVFPTYEPKMKPMTIKVPRTDGGWGTEDKEVIVVPYSQVDARDRKLMGDVRPITNDKGDKYYIVNGNDWEGANGQVISRLNTARANMDATSLSEVKRGKTSKNLVPNKNDVKLPKDIKQTRITTKPSWAN